MTQPKRMPVEKLEALEVHPFAELFPMAREDELIGIAGDIAANGFRAERAVMLFDGKLLDGRNRRKALRLAIEQKGKPISGYFRKFEGSEQEALSFVLSENLHRRHLDTSQRAIVGANLVQWQRGMNQHTEGSANLQTHGDVAEAMSISERVLYSAQKIRDRGNDQLISCVEKGGLSVNSAEALIELGDKQLAKELGRAQSDIVRRAKEIRTARKSAGRAKRTEKLNEISEKGSGKFEDLPKKAFPILYVDNPWPNEVWGEETGHEKSPPYPTMTIDEISDLCRGDRSPALDDALMFFWTTANRIAIAVDVVRAWGFEQVSAMFWDKQLMGMGRYQRDQVEILFICKRGDMHAPDPRDLESSLYSEKRGKHSVKPVHFAEMIDRQYPDLPKLELFQRVQSLADDDIRLHQRKQGRWSFWGYEAGGVDD